MTKNKIKLSFKKEEKPTGLHSIVQPYSQTEIKLNGKIFGHIAPPSWEKQTENWRVLFAVLKQEKDENPNCEWKWKHFKQEFKTEPEARIYVKENIEYILDHYKLYFFED